MEIALARNNTNVSKRNPVGVSIGVLAVQGSFNEHIIALKRLNDIQFGSELENTDSSHKNIKIEVTEIRSSEDIQLHMKGLIIPGKVSKLFVFCMGI